MKGLFLVRAYGELGGTNQSVYLMFNVQCSILLDSLVSRQGMYKNSNKHLYKKANNKLDK